MGPAGEGTRGGTMGSPTAAGVGFEPTEPCGSTAFKTAPFDRSGTPPGRVSLRGPRAGLGLRVPSVGVSRIALRSLTLASAVERSPSRAAREALGQASLEDNGRSRVARAKPGADRIAHLEATLEMRRQLERLAHRGQLRARPEDRDLQPLHHTAL